MKKLKVIFYRLVVFSFAMILQVQASGVPIDGKEDSENAFFYKTRLGNKRDRTKLVLEEANNLQCANCLKILASNKTYSDHRIVCLKKEYRYKCTVDWCTAQYPTASSLNNHYYAKHHDVWEEKQKKNGKSVQRHKRPGGASWRKAVVAAPVDAPSEFSFDEALMFPEYDSLAIAATYNLAVAASIDPFDAGVPLPGYDPLGIENYNFSDEDIDFIASGLFVGNGSSD